MVDGTTSLPIAWADIFTDTETDYVTSTSGEFIICIQAGSSIEIEISKPGYVNVTVTLDTGDDGVIIELIPVGRHNSWYH